MADPLLNALVAALDRRESLALVKVVHATGDWQSAQGARCLVWLEPACPSLCEPGLPARTLDLITREARRQLARGESAALDVAETEGAEGALRLFVDCNLRPPHLIICGAGHIAAPLAAMAKLCNFDVTVIDDRAPYASRTRFPTADRVIAGPFRAELHALRGPDGRFAPSTSLVLVTRGHQHDMECLLEALAEPVRPLEYIGMIGSSRRIRAVFELLEQERGVDPAALDGVHAPIGINIHSRTPGEIAVAILAEIINVRNGGPAPSLGDPLRAQRVARRARLQPTPPGAPTP